MSPFEYSITNSEKEIYDLVQQNHTRVQNWDMLIQGTQDYYGRHPWPIFIRYQEGNPWSFVQGDALMQSYIEQFFLVEQDDPKFLELSALIKARAKGGVYAFCPNTQCRFCNEQRASVRTTGYWDAACFGKLRLLISIGQLGEISLILRASNSILPKRLP